MPLPATVVVDPVRAGTTNAFSTDGALPKLADGIGVLVDVTMPATPSSCVMLPSWAEARFAMDAMSGVLTVATDYLRAMWTCITAVTAKDRYSGDTVADIHMIQELVADEPQVTEGVARGTLWRRHVRICAMGIVSTTRSHRAATRAHRSRKASGDRVAPRM